MIKNYILVFCIITSASLFSMDLQQWVHDAKKISIYGNKKTYNLSINDDTTIADIKAQIFIINKIPPDQQNIRAQLPGFTIFKYYEFSGGFTEPLAENSVIKLIMNEYNTDGFFVSIEKPRME